MCNITKNMPMQPIPEIVHNRAPLQQQHQPQPNPQQEQRRPKLTRPSAKDLRVDSYDLESAAKQMRSSNSLISRSIRTVLSCFDDLDIHRFESRTDYLINFISNGINKCTTSIPRPVSIQWPDNYEKMVEQLAVLDAFLLNTSFRDKPVDWMLERGLTTVPDCRQCKDRMKITYEGDIVRWQCERTQACSNYFMPVQRPSFFRNFENIGLDKLLFSVYYWATCIPSEELYTQMNIEPQTLDGIWRRIQNVCRTSLEKSYPRHRLTNVVDQGPIDNSNTLPKPIDLISIKLNKDFIVCAKHPGSNLVRLGIYIPGLSAYSFVELTESWFAHGALIRVSEQKFLGLTRKRTDLRVELVSRLEMVAKDGHYDRDSAFGYLICQLSHVFKDFDSSSCSRETLKLILAEMQWRELYGTTPFDAFTNIVNHMSQYGDSSHWYSEPSLPVYGEEMPKELGAVEDSLERSGEVWAEVYYYATCDPIDKEGKVISRFTEPDNFSAAPYPDVRLKCHSCNSLFEGFEYSLHLISHVEKNRREDQKMEYLARRLIECKHCFKPYKSNEITTHSALFRAHWQSIENGCRICCIKLENRVRYLQHMRRLHFEHETPYRCPSCKFASSFQRDVFIHFQEEHRHDLAVMCPLCLKGFKIAKPETMNNKRMNQLSRLIYDHIAEHYTVSNRYTCSNCCLCFLDKERLMAHKQMHHNPLEIHPTNEVKVQPFKVHPKEEKYCCKAMPMELFIANKRPNLKLNKKSRNKKTGENSSKAVALDEGNQDSDKESFVSCSSMQEPSADGQSASVEINGKAEAEFRSDSSVSSLSSSSSSESSSDESEASTARFSDTIHVRGLSEAQKFLKGGGPALHVYRNRCVSTNRTTTNKTGNLDDSCSSQKLIEYLSKMKRADGIIPNQSVILTPKGTPAKCCECLQLVTVDHLVAKIVCMKCKYVTHCPRAATNHNKKKHQSS